jgi:hypothetical protein
LGGRDFYNGTTIKEMAARRMMVSGSFKNEERFGVNLEPRFDKLAAGGRP